LIAMASLSLVLNSIDDHLPNAMVHDMSTAHVLRVNVGVIHYLTRAPLVDYWLS
jgi:hypothetical protein